MLNGLSRVREATITSEYHGPVYGYYSTIHNEYYDIHDEKFYSDGNYDRTTYEDVTWNPYGIEMKRETKQYKGSAQIDELLEYHKILTRDEQYPFIKKDETIVNNTGFGSPAGTKYEVIEMENLSRLEMSECLKDEKGYRGAVITFENEEQIEAYYQANKEAITNAFIKGPKYLNEANLRESVKEGLEKLAVEAGLFESVQQQETGEKVE